MSSDDPEVAVDGPITSEDLPLPITRYPNHYGAFIAFSEDRDSFPALCACSKLAVENCLRLEEKGPERRNSNPLRMAQLDSMDFPEILAKRSMEREGPPVEELRFEKGVCHRCNLATPSVRYCHEMYGSQFKQRYGWYIRQAHYRLGIDPPNYLDSVCPPKLKKLISRQESLSEERRQIVEGGNLTDPRKREIEKKTRSIGREISNYVENVVRREFGHHKIGEKWTSETIVAQIVERLLPECKVIRHHRPDWLKGLELDVYVPDHGLGIEYQGQQHFHPVEAWGGEEALQEQKERDRKTREICEAKGVDLIEIDYRDPLTEEFIRECLDEVGVRS